jgi:hypothetical protein
MGTRAEYAYQVQDEKQHDHSDSHRDSERWEQRGAPAGGRWLGPIGAAGTGAATRTRFRGPRFSLAHVCHSHLFFSGRG